MKKRIVNLIIFAFCVTNIMWQIPATPVSASAGAWVEVGSFAYPTNGTWGTASEEFAKWQEVTATATPRIVDNKLELKRISGGNADYRLPVKAADSNPMPILSGDDLTAQSDYKIVWELNNWDIGVVTTGKPYYILLGSSSLVGTGAPAYSSSSVNYTREQVFGLFMQRTAVDALDFRFITRDSSGANLTQYITETQAGDVGLVKSNIDGSTSDVFKNVKIEIVLREGGEDAKAPKSDTKDADIGYYTVLYGGKLFKTGTYSDGKFPLQGLPSDIGSLAIYNGGFNNGYVRIGSTSVEVIKWDPSAMLDKAALESAISSAQSALTTGRLNIGGAIGKYTALMCNKFEEAIVAAQAVCNSADSTQGDINAATTVLTGKTTVFLEGNTTAVPNGGLLAKAEFDDGVDGFAWSDPVNPTSPETVNSDLPTIGNYLKANKNAAISFSPTRIHNPATHADWTEANLKTALGIEGNIPSTFEVEGPCTTLIAEFDAKVGADFGANENTSETVRYELFPEQAIRDIVNANNATAKNNAPVVRIQFRYDRDAKTRTIEHTPQGGGNALLIENFKSNHWYRFRVEISVSNDTAEIDTTDNRVKIYVYDDGNVYENADTASDTRLQSNIKNRILNIGQMEVGYGSQSTTGGKGYLDNFTAYKQNAVSINAPFKRGELVTLIRKAYAKLNSTVLGTGDTNYTQADYDSFKAVCDGALALYNKPDSEITQAEIDAKSAVLRNAIDDFKAKLSIGGIAFTDEGSALLNPAEDTLAGIDELNISIPVTVNKAGASATLVAVLYKASGDAGSVVYEIETIGTDNTDNAQVGVEKSLTVTIDLFDYDESERENMYVKVFVWKDFASLMPITSFGTFGGIDL